MIYLDNAATSFPKPPQVVSAVTGAMTSIGASPGRGGHQLALRAIRIVQACREEAALLLGMKSPERVIFTRNCTESLNLAIAGTLHRGDEVLCTHAEHNAVMRLLDRHVTCGDVTVRVLPPDRTGVLQPHTLQRFISPRTALVIICHASNVTGVVQPVARLGAVCRENGVPLLVDAAQTAGILDVSPSALHADMVAMPGHKGLLGPQGTGLLALGEGVDPEPLILGGTGSASESVRQPEMLPDRYESGTLNLPGIAGLLCGLRFVRHHRQEICEYEHYLAQRLRSQLSNIPGLRVLGHPDAPSVSVVSVVPEHMDSSLLTDSLDASGIAVRGGLHCAPSIHTWLGTLESGAVRFSPGLYNTQQDIDDAAAVVERLMKQ